MKTKLGTVYMPEQYASAEDVCTADNSFDARRYFKNITRRNGEAFLANAKLDLLDIPCLLIWAYVDIDKAEIISWRPVFVPEDAERLAEARFLDMAPVENEIYIFWQGQLYATVFTSTGEVAVKKVRAIFSEKDMLNIIALEGAIDATGVYPVELYSPDEERFVCVCWSIETADDEVIWKPISFDDEEISARYEGKILEEYPIELGETAVIGGYTFKLCYSQGLDAYFQRVPDMPEVGKKKRIFSASAA